MIEFLLDHISTVDFILLNAALGLSIYLTRSVTSLAIPDGFLQPRTDYKWEVLAIERSGNQTLSSSSFRTR